MGKRPAAPRHVPFCYTAAKLSEAQDESQPTEFRLLELLPSANPGDELSCHIFVAKIGESCRRYKALSYCWGQGSKSESILVVSPDHTETKALAITASLHDALRHLRNARKPIWLWVDQICINQEDGAEKSSQVGLMSSIYASAELVLVWLGPAADFSDLLMEAWQTTGQAARDWGLESYYTRERYPLLKPIVDAIEPSNPATILMQAQLRTAAEVFAPLVRARVLNHWFQRPWFTRAWVVQEFCLCPDTVFVCGTKTVPVELVMLALQILHWAMSKRELLRVIDGPANDVPRWVLLGIIDEPTARLFSCRQRRRKFDLNVPGATGDALHVLLRKLYVEHNTQATLPRDRVFSLLGLAVDTEQLGIRPDYTGVTPGQLDPAAEARMLTRAARAMITNSVSGRIDILCFSQFPKSPENPGLAKHLPSWVPDWRGDLKASFYTVNEVADAHLFAACGSELRVKPVSYTSSFSQDESPVLGLGGYVVDTINCVAEGGTWDEMSWDAARFLGYLRQVDGLFQQAMQLDRLPRLYSSQERRKEARWRVPIGDLYWTRAEDMCRASAEAAVYHRQALEFFQFMADCEGLSSHEQQRRAEAWDLTGKSAKGEIGGDYRESMKYVVGKRPFLTSEGYLGMGPADAAPGDVVVVFCGGRIPFVLRPLNSDLNEKKFFSFVGEAYCDGAMDGEAVERGELGSFFLV